MSRHNTLFEEKGLRRVENLEEVMDGNSYIAWSRYDETGFPVYPIVSRRQIHLTHNMLSLYGTHWRYLVDTNWESVEKQDGDEVKILDELSRGIRGPRWSHYVFTQKDINLQHCMWIFVPETKGWEFYNDVLIPQFQSDLADYKIKKETILAQLRT